jgi:hypothetical protein
MDSHNGRDRGVHPDSKMTGGGHANSPAGALAANPAATGIVNFTFNPLYHKDATTPSGQAKFTFRSAGLAFDSTALDWLVVANACFL